MRLKSILLLATTSTLVAGIGFFAKNSGYGNRPVLDFEEMETEEEGESEEKGIQGALESVYFMRLNEKTHTIEPEWVEAAMKQADALQLTRRASKLRWENLGPDNQGGRIRAFLLHRDSMNLMFASGVSGGLWRSNTNGQSWNVVNDQEQNLNVNCIAQTANGTIYYGTGEGGYTNLSGTRNGSPAFMGNGVYKSTNNRGVQFTKLPSTSGSAFTECNVMVAHPTDNKLWVATSSGIYLTTDDGAKFTLVRGGKILDMAIDVNGTVWASNSSGQIYKSTDGTTFTLTNNGIAPGGRTSIAISPQDPNTVYLLGSSGGKMSGLWRSTNGGSSWTLEVASNSVTDIFGSNTQGWYDNCIAVDPLNKNRCYIGGVVLAVWDNIDGFRETANTADLPWNTGYVHADKHIIQFETRTNPPTMIVGTDGGLFFSQDRFTWTPRNRGLITLQAYNVAANSKGYVTGGAQDNGTKLINFVGNAQNGNYSKNGIEIYGGDGFDAEFSKIFPNTIFVCTYYGAVRRTGNLGQSASSFWDNRIKDATATDPTKSDFNTTFTLWENEIDSSSLLFLARDAEVWVAINPTDFANPVNWFKVATNLGNDRIVEMDITPDGDHLFVAKPASFSNASRLFRIDNIQSADFNINTYPASAVPSPINKVDITPAAASGRTITSVNVDQSDKNHVIVTLGGYGNTVFVLETKNALATNPTWSNITGNLPGMPVYDAVVDTDDPKHIILGTDLGVYETTDGGASWIEANNGMARVPVFEIRGYEFKPWEGMSLYIGTHGRGFYRSYSLVTKTKDIAKNDVKLSAYPNPANSIINVVFESVVNASAKVEVYGMNGQKYFESIVKSATGENSVPVNVSALPAGYYFARVTISGNTNTVKFAVNK